MLILMEQKLKWYERKFDMTNSELINNAMLALENSYSPYSSFEVGAALVAESGKVYLGTNIENSSFGATVCAERVALFSAIANGFLGIYNRIRTKINQEVKQ